ncbi:MAG: hypothetical protein FJX72_12180, partial [Armatimonadetes bacterium]|nr:hypothetical protein [Armatimonadota bacterium]
MSNTPEVDPKSPTGDEQAEDETTEERPADPEASRVLADRWSAWQGGDDETASGDPRAERREHAAEKADEKRARAQAREMEKELARAEREERARTRREHKDIARSQAIVEHDIRVDQVKGLVKDARRSLIVFHEQGVIGVVRAVFGRRWVVVVSLCLLVVLSALTGALVMRARHRRHLTAVLVAINGTTIKRNDLSDELLNVYGRQTLDGLVQRELRRQFLVKHGAVASEKQVSERLQLESGLPDFMPILQRAGKSESEYRKSLARSLSELNLISKAVTLTDAEIREFYERNADPRP